MIKQFAVKKLSRTWDFAIKCYPDVNIFTGRNGAGKTTVLKLVWFMLSGNLQRIYPEILFESALLETDKFKLTLTVEKKGTVELLHVDLESAAGTSNHKTLNLSQAYGVSEAFEKINIEIADMSDGSVFFPTFRRIEGGFSTSIRTIYGRTRRPGSLQQAMAELADELSFQDHHFVSSMSTTDLVELLTQQFAESSRAANKMQGEFSNGIVETIRSFDQKDPEEKSDALTAATKTIEIIKKAVADIERKRAELFQPLLVLENLVKQLLRHKGIRMGDVATFGDAGAALEAGQLSAGEKQMLSFLCFNAFRHDSAIFIDEPEISLHPDWQRVLFPKLLEQGGDNQFLVATHSPFIYSKYSDREHRLDELGDGNEQN